MKETKVYIFITIKYLQVLKIFAIVGIKYYRPTTFHYYFECCYKYVLLFILVGQIRKGNIRIKNLVLEDRKREENKTLQIVQEICQILTQE